MNENIGLQNNSHNYRTEIPNCVIDAKIGSFNLTVYTVIKRIAGDSGICFMSLKHLAEKCDLGLTKLKECLDKLCEINKTIGHPLLVKTTRKKDNGSLDTSVYTIVDLWLVNIQSYCKNISGKPQYDQGVGRNTTEGRSPGDYKEEHIKNNPIKKDDDDLKKPASNPKKGKADASHHQRQSQIKIKEDKSFFSIQKADYETLRKCFHEIRESEFNDQLMRCFNKVIFEGIHRVCYKKYIHNWFQNYLREKK